MRKCVKTKELFDCRCEYLKELFENKEYPWEILPEIEGFIKKIISRKMQGFTEIKKDVFNVTKIQIKKTKVRTKFIFFCNFLLI